ncbi:hypothetical protein O0I10_011603 [Lichtheimia ornata]|uniref:Uncharacterized protein n=1 Tax=Lichtheimia ornata TaxID=688661 RepID=A0AAD7UUX9_9FUNG|nr:uncharacterized protein O0I10_011603 [Lichtheimia ornata]KAJ8652721.1 hypothetical protein O0I10_011603 [Lichtheimia ornata]
MEDVQQQGQEGYYQSSTSRDGVYCLKGEGHVVVRGYYVGLTVRPRFKNAPSDLSWRTKYMLPIIALLYFTRLGRRWVSFLATWLDPRLVVLKSAGEGLHVTVKTGVLTPRSYGRLEGSAGTAFLGSALLLLLLLLETRFIAAAS